MSRVRVCGHTFELDTRSFRRHRRRAYGRAMHRALKKHRARVREAGSLYAFSLWLNSRPIQQQVMDELVRVIHGEMLPPEEIGKRYGEVDPLTGEIAFHDGGGIEPPAGIPVESIKLVKRYISIETPR